MSQIPLMQGKNQLPLYDDNQQISFLKAVMLIVIPVVVFWAVLSFSSLYDAQIKKSIDNKVILWWIGEFTTAIIPFLLIVGGIYLTIGEKIATVLSKTIKGHWKSVIYTILIMFVYSSISISVLKSVGYSIVADKANSDVTTIAGFTTTLIFSIIELFNEELMGIFVLLGAAIISQKYIGLSRNFSLFIGVIISATLFGALHYDAYSGHLLEMFVTISGLRIILDILYLRTKSIRATFAAHFLYDNIGFGLTLLTALANKH
ncbi:CPBP family intramembrane metalloprotease [Weissella muntiaci]|uniref:CPBP family intramembrane metalloprotease n=1 Tax=Weissella muntiaci TaxID=2508881 RepID=A0A6C2C7I4_9LACO|nr:CPBP family intramembrane glutamic endopeptidase [Weissella muntiaci]TYC49622.1 CPBP family intramembrane metalloprotease [Weissella muntiaci]